MKLYLANAFSLSMLDREVQGTEEARAPLPIGVERVAAMIKEYKRQYGEEPVSIVNHRGTAGIFTTVLGCDVAFNKQHIHLEPEDRLIVGLRLDGTISWWLI